MSGLIRLKGYEKPLARTRDVVKRTAHGVDFVICGLENQQRAHYAMPLRTLLYDGLGYLKEYRELTGRRRKETDRQTEEEFLSGLHREDRLHPILTLVVYYGENPWDGPLCLRDMITEMPKPIGDMFSDYRMNLVQICDSERYDFRNDEVRTVFEISRELQRGRVDHVLEQYKNKDVTEEILTVIGTILGSQQFVQPGKKRRSEHMQLCTALENWRQEENRKGYSEGVSQRNHTLATRWFSDGRSMTEIALLLGLPEAEVREILTDEPPASSLATSDI